MTRISISPDSMSAPNNRAKHCAISWPIGGTFCTSGTSVASKPKLARPARFIETMDCLGVKTLPEGAEWSYEIKLDGFRLEVIRSEKGVALYSRRQNVLNVKFPYVAAALTPLPATTIVDGEL